MTISIIAAVARNGVIGADSGVPWHIPSDMRSFVTITMGKPLIMGRKTWESLKGALPGRTNIVVTRREDYEADGGVVVHSPEEALEAARRAAGESGEVMVAGGSSIYEAFLPAADRMYLSRVDADVEGDTRFPEVDWEEWQTLHEVRVDREEDEHPYTFMVLRRLRRQQSVA
ncbi:MAG: dihydrofolate reductase [Candidatus Palauibacterales bacterium]|nr:dihydrofolate reductase [Candidatus Palauibacterales bacterium]